MTVTSLSTKVLLVPILTNT